MSLTKQTVVDQTTIHESGVVFYREATRIFEDGEQISQSFHRTTLVPGQDLTGHPDTVVAICNSTWTPNLIAAYQAAQNAR